MNQLDGMGLFLVCGLLAHKAVWEWMKRGQPAQARQPLPWKTRGVRAVKVAILLCLLAQPFLPNFWPLPEQPGLVWAGLCLYSVGLLTAIAGRLQLGNNWLDIESANVKRGQTTVSHGLYRFIRHPIYTGDLLLLIGYQLALRSWLVAVAVLLVPVVLRQAVREEGLLLHRLPGYDRYCSRTKRFIPFVA